MQPLPDWLNFALLAAGTACNVLGLTFGVRAYLLIWKEHGERELLPRTGLAIDAVHRFARRLAFWRKPPEPVSVAGCLLAGAEGVGQPTTAPGFPDVDNDADRFAQLQRAVEQAFRQMSEDRGRVNRMESDLKDLIARLDDRLSAESRQLQVDIDKAAAGGVRLQLKGLVFVAVGTFVAAVPSVWNAVATI